MPVTRLIADRTLFLRCRANMDYAKAFAYDANVSPPVINRYLDDPISEGMRSLGFYPADPTAVTDADLLPISPESEAQFYDVAELRLLETILGNLAKPDQMAGEEAQQFHGRFRMALEATVARKQAAVTKRYGYGLRPLSAGTYDLGFTTRMPHGGREGYR